MLATQSITPHKDPKYYIAATGPDGAAGIVAADDGNYKYHVFTATKSGATDGFNVSSVGNAAGSNTVEYLVIAGGAPGGVGHGGGGGAGGYRTATGLSVSAQNYAVTVGATGSVGVYTGTDPSDGNVSTFSSISSTGGGHGGSQNGTNSSYGTGSPGGSGGGGGGRSNPPRTGGTGNVGAYTPVEGYVGGVGNPNQIWAGGGGSGASEAGAAYGTGMPSQYYGGTGGDGRSSTITGSAVTRAGGGGVVVIRYRFQ